MHIQNYHPKTILHIKDWHIECVIYDIDLDNQTELEKKRRKIADRAEETLTR